MQSFLERVDSICKYIDTFIETIGIQIRMNKFLVLMLISIIGIATTYWSISFWSLFIFICIVSKDLVDTKKMAYRIEYYDKDTPILLKEIITDAINEYYIYHFTNMTGKVPYINDEQEIEFNHGVLDILLVKLDGSVLQDKFKLYYGSNYVDIMVVQTNLTITEFVVRINNMEPEKRKNIKSATNISNNTDISSLIKNVGFKEVR